MDPEYCRWLQANPDARPDMHCRYSEGTLFEDGPPEHECAPGAYELAPFCGGACGDACPAFLFGGCVGVSETRGFGVCAPDGYARCNPSDPDEIQQAFNLCAAELFTLRPGEADTRCACMVLTPMALPEYADHGWAVSRQTCLAYQARYPEEVRCYDETWSGL